MTKRKFTEQEKRLSRKNIVQNRKQINYYKYKKAQLQLDLDNLEVMMDQTEKNLHKQILAYEKEIKTLEHTNKITEDQIRHGVDKK